MNPNLPVGRSAFDFTSAGGSAELPESVTSASLGFTYARYGNEQEGTTTVAGDPLTLKGSLALLSAEHFFGAGWSVHLGLPMGAITESSRQVSGFGDLELGSTYDFAGLWGLGGYHPSLAFGLSVGFPTGERRQENVKALATVGDDVVPVNLLGLGTGAFMLGVRLDWVQPLHPLVSLRVPISLRTPLSRNDQGLLFGTTVSAGLGVAVFPVAGLTVSTTATATFGAASDESGEGRIINSGGTYLAADFGISGRLNDTVALGLRARLPFYQDVQGRQVVESFQTTATVALRFGGTKDEEQPEPNAAVASEPPSEPGDVAVAASGGRSFHVADWIAPGKVTVFDFWAGW